MELNNEIIFSCFQKTKVTYRMSAAPYNYDYILKYIIIGDQVCEIMSVGYQLDWIEHLALCMKQCNI